jgi:hypothetical protein
MRIVIAGSVLERKVPTSASATHGLASVPIGPPAAHRDRSVARKGVVAARAPVAWPARGWIPRPSKAADVAQ